jgi:transposase InsO family protein
LIHELRGNFDITELCDALGVSRSGYHGSLTRSPGPRTKANQQLLKEMKIIHDHRHTRAYGSPRMARELRASGQPCSENRVARLMRLHGMRARPRRPFRPKTTSPDHAAHPSPNLLAQAGPPDAPGRQIVSDITYIPTSEGWLYLAVVIDLFSRCVLGWKLSSSLHSDVVAAALSQAHATGLIPRGALFHSDQGCQYSSGQIRSLLARYGLVQSMSARGYCYDNAFAESAFASIKNEVLPEGQSFPSRQAASTALFDYFQTFYNRRRLHSSLDYLSPETFLNQYFQNLNSSLN